MTEQEIFAAAIKLTGDRRAEFLKTACGDDEALRGQVEALLRAHDESGGLLPKQTDRDLEATQLAHSQAKPGMLVGGRYRLLEAIGEGGMGTVWMAEQKEPVKRKVAVKLVKAGMDTAQVLARFEAERQALALMDHPNIAKVFDGGMTEQGRPYFVMEFVKGVPLTDYCNQARLSLEERLHLFIPVCQAVQHAHQKGVIHRDLKPSNILICLYDGKPVPKVIDFGLAKAMHHSLTEQTLHTAFGMMVGTPLYMSPEQAEHNNLDVDTRTDIYSLGVILYELLTGTTPLERQQLKEAAYNEILRLIKEVEPPKPSTRLSGSASLPSIAAQRSIDPKQLSRSLTGDLDWIVMKALDKERSRRYETANGLARDVERFLNDEAVEASPPSTNYRLRKLIRKHRTLLRTSAAFALLLIVGICISTWQAIRATKAEGVARQALAAEAQQRQRAEQNQRDAEVQRTNAEAFANAEAVQRAKAETARDQTREALDAMTSTVTGDSLTTQAEISQDQKKFLMEVLTYYQAFAGEKAEDETARDRTAAAAYRVGMIEGRLGRREQGIAAYEMARDGYAALAADFPAEPEYRGKLATSHNHLGTLLRDLEKLPEAEEQYRKALAIQQELTAEFLAVPKYRQNLADIHNRLGNLLKARGKFPAAEEQYLKAVAIGEQLAAEFPTVPAYQKDLAVSLVNLGALLRGLGKPSEEQHRRALSVRENLAAAFPTEREYRFDLANSHSNLMELMLASAKRAEAVEHCRKALSIRAKLATDFPSVPYYRRDLSFSHEFLGLQLRDQGNLPEAEEQHSKSVAILDTLVADFPTVPLYRWRQADAHGNLRIVLRSLGKLKEEEQDHHRTIALHEKLVAAFPADPQYQLELRDCHLARARFYDEQQKHAEAAADWNKFIELSRPFDLAGANFIYGGAQVNLGKLEEAESAFKVALDLRVQAANLAGKDAKGPNWLVATCLYDCGVFYLKGNQPEQAENWFGRAIPILEAFELQWPGADVTKRLLGAHYNRAVALGQLKRYSEAIEVLDLVIGNSSTKNPPDIFPMRAAFRALAGQVTEAIAEVADLTKSSNWRGDQWYNFSCVYSIASSKIADKKQEYADRAMELLQQAVKAGWKDAAHLAKDSDLDPLRDREDFKKLLNSLNQAQTASTLPAAASAAELSPPTLEVER